MRPKQKTEKEMFPLVESYLSFKGSVKEFLEPHKIPATTFYYWLSKYKRPQQVAINSPSFVQLTSQRLPENSISSISIHLPNGIRISVDQPITSDYFIGITTTLSGITA